MIVYGIKNCDTVKKARRWFEANGLEFEFHDFRADGLEQKTIELWLKKVPWELLLNKRGRTWRNIEDPRKDKLDQLIAIELMVANPTLIKRPVVSYNNDVMVGFKEQDYVTYFGK